LRGSLYSDGEKPSAPVHSVERKLAAIFAADIAGSSRLMARDEVGTLARLMACRVIMDGLILPFPAVFHRQQQRGLAAVGHGFGAFRLEPSAVSDSPGPPLAPGCALALPSG
jgi:hypothetical protein